MDTSVRAPELDLAVAWLNVARPLSLRELRGSVVILDFWTYCCVNCMHVVPVLREIERRHEHEPVVVIGVHSGKFSAEKDPERVLAAMGRYGVEHPVAVDDDMALWSRYAIRSWPTIVVVRPDGRIAAVAPGEPDLETLDSFIVDELERAKKAGTLALERPELPRQQEDPKVCGTLRYPGKATITPDDRLLISDSGHHRVLVTARDGRVVLTAGSGQRGWVDGELARARFDDPQGLCYHRGAVYVADTRNHAIRRIDLEGGLVTTVAGTGQLGSESPSGRVVATSVGLRSPWDLVSVGDVVFVAMAGSHQVWRFYPDSGEIEVYAGSGVEALLDGKVATSAWAQPSGLAHHNGMLYVADSESSAIRAIDLTADTVATLVGQGLFAFGDDDGSADEAMLQHCMGIAVDGEELVIADTYNGKIKRWSAHEGQPRIRTVLDGLEEPGSAVVADDGVIIIADTNRHRILCVREGAIAELPVSGAPLVERASVDRGSAERGSVERGSVARGGGSEQRGVAPAPSTRGWFTNLIELPAGLGLKPGDAGISLILETPPGTELAPQSPMQVAVEVSRRSDLLLVPRPALTLQARGGKRQLVAIDARVLPTVDAVVEAEVIVTIDYVACRRGEADHCVPERVHVRLPVRLLARGGERQLEFGVSLASIDGAGEEHG